MNDLKKLVREVLADGFVMNLGISDQNQPWVASLVYIFDEEFNIYWISPPSTRHSLTLAKNPSAACTILASHTTDQERALQIQGVVSILSGSNLEREQALQRKRGVTISNIPGSALKGTYQWYKLTPTSIDLIYNMHFGYERKKFL